MPQIVRYFIIFIYYTSTMSQLILETRQPEPSTIPVEREPVQEGTKLLALELSWEDFLGLSWISEDE